MPQEDGDAPPITTTATTTTVVWDGPVRLVHWALVLALPAMWWTAENDEMGWHMRIGVAVLALLAFRIVWGFAGSSTARFANFVRGPGRVFAYLRGKSDFSDIGHNPAGAYSVLALLGLLALQVTLGLFSGDVDDGVTGPLYDLVSYSAADLATDWHEIVFYFVLAAVALHILAILFYRFVRRDDLVTPMITGRRKREAGQGEFRGASPLRALLSAALALAIAWWVWSGAPPLG